MIIYVWVGIFRLVQFKFLDFGYSWCLAWLYVWLDLFNSGDFAPLAQCRRYGSLGAGRHLCLNSGYRRTFVRLFGQLRLGPLLHLRDEFRLLLHH